MTSDPVMKILESLPVLTERSDRLKSEALRIEITATLAGLNDRPCRRKGGSKKAIQSLETLIPLLGKSINHFRDMPSEAHDALEHEVTRIQKVQSQTRGWRLTANPNIIDMQMLSLAKIALAAVEELKGTDITRSSKPSKTAAWEVAKQAKYTYQTLTGKRATVATKDGKAYGPFLDFVANIFRATGIKASPETWAREAVKTRSVKEKR